MKFRSLLATGLLALGLVAPALAHTEIFTAPLLGTSEFPSNASPGTGMTTVTLDLDLLTMRVEATFAGLTGNVSASHIHCCTASPGGSNVGVATMTPSFVGFPSGLGVTSGSYDHTFDMALATSYNAAFITANGGTVATAFNALVLGLESGNAYLNIHTSTFPGGEIRGLLAPVPEPETYALMALGLVLVGAAAKRRRA